MHSFCISEILSNFAELYDYGVTLPIKVLPKKLEKQIYNSVLNDLGIKKKIKKEAIDNTRRKQSASCFGCYSTCDCCRI